MKPVRVKNASTVFGADQAGVRPLAVRQGRHALGPTLTAAFKPSADELERLNNGGAVELVIVGGGWPPVLLDVVEGYD